MLTANNSDDAVLAAFAAGADSYSLKDVSVENLLNAIQLTHEGNAWIDPNIARVILQKARESRLQANSSRKPNPLTSSSP